MKELFSCSCSTLWCSVCFGKESSRSSRLPVSVACAMSSLMIWRSNGLSTSSRTTSSNFFAFLGSSGGANCSDSTVACVSSSVKATSDEIASVRSTLPFLRMVQVSW